jgi:ribosomal 50S subunit-recycling heat shock protein
MKSSRFLTTAACVAGALCLASVVLAETPAAAPAAAPKGEAMMASVEVTATVTKIDQKTREVTVKTDDGQERSFVAGEEAKNLAQVKVGDRITVTYAEALVYEVKKGGAAVAPASAVAGKAAQPGMKPAGAIARQTTVTVLITAIDTKAPSVTFKGAGGNTQTIKVMHPEKLQGVKVGDTVEITYTEALAIKVEEAPRK